MRGKWVLAGIAVVVIAAGGTWIVNRDPAKAAGPSAPPPAIPVVFDLAKKQDVPITRGGLGTVQAYNTVTVHGQVTGQLMQIAFKEGQEVKAGDVLAQIDPRSFQATLDQAVAQKAKDEAQLANAKLDLQRYQSLIKNEYASKQSVDTQQALVAQDAAAVQGDQAAIDNAKVQLGYTTITAPIGGRTGIRQIDAGNIIHTTDTNGLVVITQLQPISVIFTLPEDLLPRINRNSRKGGLTVEAWSEDDQMKLDTGKVDLVDNQIDTTTGTMKLKASFPNADHQLWPGQFVNAHLLIETQHDGITVPSQAVQRGPQGTFVWIINAEDAAEMRPATVGQTANGISLIEKGLQAGDKVVTDGQYKLRVGAKVKATQMAPPDQTASLPAGAQGAKP